MLKAAKTGKRADIELATEQLCRHRWNFLSLLPDERTIPVDQSHWRASGHAPWCGFIRLGREWTL